MAKTDTAKGGQVLEGRRVHIAKALDAPSERSLRPPHNGGWGTARLGIARGVLFATAPARFLLVSWCSAEAPTPLISAKRRRSESLAGPARPTRIDGIGSVSSRPA